MPDGHYLTPEQYDLFMRMGQWFKTRIGDPTHEYRPNIQHVRITGESVCSLDGVAVNDCVDEDGLLYYPGIVVMWDATEQDWREAGICWVRDANESGLTENDIWVAKQSGNLTITGQDNETRPVFITNVGGSGSETVTVVTCFQELP